MKYLGLVLVLAACAQSSAPSTISASDINAMPRVNFDLARCADTGPANGANAEIYLCSQNAPTPNCFVYVLGGVQHGVCESPI